MTDKPIETIEFGYDGVIDLHHVLAHVYNDNRLAVYRLDVMVEYVSGHEPQFFQTPVFEWTGKNFSGDDFHAKKVEALHYNINEAEADFAAVSKQENITEVDYYDAVSLCYRLVAREVSNFCDYLTFNKAASSAKKLQMNKIVMIEKGGWFSSDRFGTAYFYMACHPNEKRTDGEIGKTVLKFTPAGKEAKTVILSDVNCQRKILMQKSEEILRLEQQYKDRKKQIEDQKTGYLTPQNKLQDALGTKPITDQQQNWLLCTMIKGVQAIATTAPATAFAGLLTK